MRSGAAKLALLALVCGLALPQPVLAQATSPVVILTQDRLYAESRYGQAVQAASDSRTRALQDENRKIEADLEAEEKALTERRASLPPAEFRQLADAFDTKVEGIRTAQDAKARALTRTNEAERKRFFDTAVPVLAQLMAEMGAVAILDKSAIVLSFDRIDITGAAITRIDAVLGDGSTPPAPVVSAPTPAPVPVPAPVPEPAPQTPPPPPAAAAAPLPSAQAPALPTLRPQPRPLR